MEKAMRFMVILAILAIFPIVGVSSAVTEKSLPDYGKWKTCVVEKINDKLLKRVCLDDSMPSNNMIAEFIFDDGKNQQAELLIWIEYVHSGKNQTRMVNRFYVWITGSEKWKLVDITVFDIHTLPIGKKVNLFFEDSTFGKAFFDLYKKAGIEKESINIPFVINTND